MPNVEPTSPAVNGFKATGVHCGLKKNNKLDFALIVSEAPCTAAGVFTTNEVKAAPLLVDIERLKANDSSIRAVAVNTGSANACTGEQGIQNALATARYVAQKIGCQEDEVLVLSTGVIGLHLPMEKIICGIDLAAESLGDDWESTAKAIMTTDTRHKLASVSTQNSQGQTYTITGISKGSGMIAPNMATMLGVIVTDAGVPEDTLHHLLKIATEISYNRIVVDGDMSTNDTVLLLANGTSGASIDSTEDLQSFGEALTRLCTQLAQEIVKDGEGVTKFITLKITGAASDEAAHKIANTIATSPLVKTAFFGEDANWGRIVAAAGRAGIPIHPERITVTLRAGEEPSMEGLHLMYQGVPHTTLETSASQIMKESAISILMDFDMGQGEATIWTCDLSHDYVSINGDYRS